MEYCIGTFGWHYDHWKGVYCRRPVIATSDFAYARFHGSNQLYSSDYSENELEDWAGKISDLKVNTVYIYFNNHIGGFATKNAQYALASV